MEELIFLDISTLNLPDDVIENSGDAIMFMGYDKITDDPNEIIVITQFGRMIGTAFLCHLEHPKDPECIYEINDIPDYPVMKIKRDWSIKEINGKKYTMVCMDSKDFDYCRPNWLY